MFELRPAVKQIKEVLEELKERERMNPPPRSEPQYESTQAYVPKEEKTQNSNNQASIEENARNKYAAPDGSVGKIVQKEEREENGETEGIERRFAKGSSHFLLTMPIFLSIFDLIIPSF
jgi:hypothetical protein